MNPHRLMWGPESDMPWAMIVICATMVGCVVAREPRRFPVNAVTVMIMLFIASFSFGTIFAMAGSDEVMAKYFWVLKVYGVALLTAALLTSRLRIHALIWVMVLSLAFFGIKGGGFTLLTGGSSRVWGPPGTMITDNNHVGAALLVCLPLMNYLRLQSAHRMIRMGLAAAMFLTTFAVVGTYSRGALVGLVAVTLFLWLKSSKKLVSGIAIVAVMVAAVAFMPSQWGERMNTIQTYEQDGSAESRIELWGDAWTMAIHRPLTGVGFSGTYSRSVADRIAPGLLARAIHSIYFECLAEQGFPGFFIWIGITVAGWITAQRIIREGKNVAGLEWAVDLARMGQCSIIAYLTAGTFLSLSYWDFYYTLLVAIGATRAQVLLALGKAGSPTWARAAPARPPLAVPGPAAG
jgi:probable O-glycosylation ligase (exosortase A-associated)